MVAGQVPACALLCARGRVMPVIALLIHQQRAGDYGRLGLEIHALAFLAAA
ncbi:MAG TPA: hypothetical protein VK631_05005 [Solirubrobacteraceae bacterium]|nr:hypothetical protein [Solirubrobacteraceae bacterium]